MAGRFPVFGDMLPTWLHDAFIPNDRVNLGLYRLLHFMVLALFATRLIAKNWRGLSWPILRPLIVCGEQSLSVFCAGVFLSLAGHFILVTGSGSLVAQILVSVSGIAIMTLVASYVSWSKRQDRPVSGADGPHALRSGPARTTPGASALMPISLRRLDLYASANFCVGAAMHSKPRPPLCAARVHGALRCRTISPSPARLLGAGRLSGEREARIDRTATRLIEAIRSNDDRLGGVEDMLREFALSTKEGLALMVLAEALLRVPDAGTADRFIEDKLGEGDFIHHETRSSAFLVNASAWALGMSARVIQPGETPDGTIGRLVKRLGAPAVRAATRQAMRLMGSHFVLGETIEAALARAQSGAAPRYSFDMLGEGARTAADAERYFNAYASAIDAIGASAGTRPLPDRPGISIKLSALHPRFEALSRQRVMVELVPRLIDLAQRAKSFNLNLTVDAEEADRLELSLEVIAASFCRRIARGLGRLRPGHSGLSEARRRSDRLRQRTGRQTEPAHDGAARQGRLLGQRDQARAGARAAPTIPSSPARR